MRVRTVSLALLLGGCAGPALFVDQIEDGRAVLVDPSGHVLHVPATALPADAGEGMWLGDPDPDLSREIASRRARLGSGDDGRDLVLGR